jgi:hypothetical protein
MWHAASLPETIRRMYGNWLLDCWVCKEMRLSEGISGTVHVSRLCVSSAFKGSSPTEHVSMAH